jgi:imidazolonepropionase-like amidohydrolase
MGSDCGNAVTPHGGNAYELELMVRYGMKEMEAILAATSAAAAALRISEDTGTIEPNKSADLIVVNGDPLSDIAVLQDRTKIELVMKEGSIFR